MRNTLGILFFLTLNFINAQTDPVIDSLYREIRKAKADSSIAKLQIDLSFQWRFYSLDSALSHADKAKAVAENCGFDYGAARATFAKGFAYNAYQRTGEALDYYLAAMKMFQEQGRKKDIVKMDINTGVLYSSKNNYTKALQLYYNALELLEEVKDDKLLSLTLGNIGTIHYYNFEYDKAIDFCQRALDIDKKLDNPQGVALHLGNIGSYYLDIGTRLLKQPGKEKEAKEKFEKGISNLTEAFKMYEVSENQNGMALTLGNLGNAFYDIGDTLKALEYYGKAFQLDSTLGNKKGMSRHTGNIGYIYYDKKEYSKAEKYMMTALQFAREDGDIALMIKWHGNLTYVYEKTKNFEKALDHNRIGQQLRDSLFNLENAKKNLETEMNFEFQKKEVAAKEENERQTLYRNIFIAGFAVMFIMVLLIFRSYRIKQKANKLISEQKELLEIKNKEITDSIKYAKRIQNAHMPSNEYIIKKLNELKKS